MPKLALFVQQSPKFSKSEDDVFDGIVCDEHEQELEQEEDDEPEETENSSVEPFDAVLAARESLEDMISTPHRRGESTASAVAAATVAAELAAAAAKYKNSKNKNYVPLANKDNSKERQFLDEFDELVRSRSQQLSVQFDEGKREDPFLVDYDEEDSTTLLSISQDESTLVSMDSQSLPSINKDPLFCVGEKGLFCSDDQGMKMIFDATKEYAANIDAFNEFLRQELEVDGFVQDMEDLRQEVMKNGLQHMREIDWVAILDKIRTFNMQNATQEGPQIQLASIGGPDATANKDNDGEVFFVAFSVLEQETKECQDSESLNMESSVLETSNNLPSEPSRSEALLETPLPEDPEPGPEPSLPNTVASEPSEQFPILNVWEQSSLVEASEESQPQPLQALEQPPLIIEASEQFQSHEASEQFQSHEASEQFQSHEASGQSEAQKSPGEESQEPENTVQESPSEANLELETPVKETKDPEPRMESSLVACIPGMNVKVSDMVAEEGMEVPYFSCESFGTSPSAQSAHAQKKKQPFLSRWLGQKKESPPGPAEDTIVALSEDTKVSLSALTEVIRVKLEDGSMASVSKVAADRLWECHWV